MSNLNGIPSADYYETRLTNMRNGTNGTVYVEKVPSGSMPISEYSYIVVNPGEVNMQVAKIDGWDSDNDTFNVVDVAIPSGAGTYYNATNHPVGSVVRFSNNYAFWKDIQEAVNSKIDTSSLAPVAVSNDYNDLCNKPTIPTDNCELCNSCGYITGINCTDVTTALGYTPYDSTNPNGYTTCTGTLTSSDLVCYAQCCDIPDISCLAQCCDLPDVSGFVEESCIACINGCCLTEGGDICIQGGGGGNMEACVYDPNNCATDAFDYCNMYNTPTIPTDNCELANSCGFTTCTGTLTACDIANLAQCCDIPSVSGLAQCCDIPTDNCQLGNSCGYTTCTGTLTSDDIACLAQCCDLACKQDTLTAGNNISINSNTISADFNYAEPTTAAACTTKCVCIPEITQLCVGQQITVKPTVTNTAGDTKLKLNGFTEYPIRYLNSALSTTSDGQVWGANCFATFIFDGSYWHVASKSYDVNTTYTLNTLLDAGKHIAGTGTYALSRYSLVMEKDDGTWEKITNTSAAYSTATTKTVNTNGFRLNHIRYYNTSTNVATGALIATNTLANQAASVDLRYSTNCGGTTTWSEGDYIYLVGTIKTDGLFYLDTTQWWTNALPTTNDGKLYIRIGIALAAAGYTASLLLDRPVFYYDNGIKEYLVADNKQDKSAMVTTLTGADNDHYPTAKAVSDAIQGAGAGDMLASVYDPCNRNTDAFDYCNFYNTPTIPDVSNLAQCCDIPTDNCQLGNSCGYTTCTGTVVAGDLAPFAKCCELGTVAFSNKYCDLSGQPTIPTDNCQLGNSCGFTTCTGTVSTCADIISKLGYTPYNSTNPNGYTTCTGTLVAGDLAGYAQCCDIPTVPTDNCQLANGCGYTTCTGTLQSCDIACINGCCLTQGGDITISGGSDYSRCTQTISGGCVTLCLRTIVNTPSSDFTLVKPATLLDGEEYAIRVVSSTSHCMCLGTCFTNPRNVDTCLSANATDQYVFLSIGGELELQPLVDTGS